MADLKAMKKDCILNNFRPKNAILITTYSSPMFKEEVRVYFWMKHFIHKSDSEAWIAQEARGLKW